MDADKLTFNRGVIKPLECMQAGWELIKKDYWLFLGISFVGVLVGSVVPIVLMGACMCGIYLCLIRKKQGREVTFSMLFEGFNYFVQGLIATLVMAVPAFLLMLPVIVLWFVAVFTMMPRPSHGQPPDGSAAGIFFLLYFLFLFGLILISTIVGALFCFTYPLIVDRKLSGWDAALLSLKAAFANLGGVVGLMILHILLSMVGSLACCIGSYFVLPINFASVFVAYRHVFTVDAGDGVDEAGYGVDP